MTMMIASHYHFALPKPKTLQLMSDYHITVYFFGKITSQANWNLVQQMCDTECALSAITEAYADVNMIQNHVTCKFTWNYIRASSAQNFFNKSELYFVALLCESIVKRGRKKQWEWERYI